MRITICCVLHTLGTHVGGVSLNRALALTWI
jgi:hypothetical protein